MKKYLYLLLLIFTITLFLSACSSDTDNTLEESERLELIDSGEYYRIHNTYLTHVRYDIYDKNGEIVMSDETDRPLRINMLCDDIVDIRIGIGTGVAVHKYYDAVKNIFSQEYCYVLTAKEDLVAFIDVPEKEPFKNRKVVVRNIFYKSLFYMEYYLDFSNVDTPVIDAEFSNDSTSLRLKFLSGESQTETFEILYLYQ